MEMKVVIAKSKNKKKQKLKKVESSTYKISRKKLLSIQLSRKVQKIVKFKERQPLVFWISLIFSCIFLLTLFFVYIKLVQAWSDRLYETNEITDESSLKSGFDNYLINEEPTPTPEELNNSLVSKPTVRPRKDTPTPTKAALAPLIPSGGRIEGYVRLPDGEPAAKAALILSCNCNYLSEGNYEIGQSNDSGYYGFDKLPAGTYKVKAQYEDYQQVFQVSIKAGRSTILNIALATDPATIPETTIISGPGLREEPGDPDNYYCTKVKIKVDKCCSALKVLLSYDNENAVYKKLGDSCLKERETYICEVLEPGQHLFYYRAINDYCAEEEMKSVIFTAY